jgi:hypothetical protein
MKTEYQALAFHEQVFNFQNLKTTYKHFINNWMNKSTILRDTEVVLGDMWA